MKTLKTVFNKSLPTRKYRVRLLESNNYTIYFFDVALKNGLFQYLHSCTSKEEAESYEDFIKNQKLA